MPSVLIVDDEPNIRRMLGALLAAEGYEVRDAADGDAAVAAAADVAPDVVLLDLMMPGSADGLATLRRLHEGENELPVIMMSGRAGLSDAVRATKLGAFNFLEKPLSPETVLLAIGAAVELRQARAAARTLRQELGLGGPLVGTSAPMRRVAEMIARVAASDARVLIVGESGTGKELVAAAIHSSSPRRDRPFIRVNCAAIPRDLVESEMFGHERGAFTGAIDRRIGRFEMAHTGTLMLDEVGDLGAEAQAKLLRAIEAKEIERVGGRRPIRTDVRIVAATNKDLPRAVAEGGFREDLYFRLAVIPLTLPALRHRPTDIPALVRHFTAVHRARTGRAVEAWTDEAMAVLTAYRWPGNVRELANIVERIAILHAGEVVSDVAVRSVLPVATRDDARPGVPGSSAAYGAPEADPIGRGFMANGPGVADTLRAPHHAAAPDSLSALATANSEQPLTDALDAYERELITQALTAADGNITEAARRLQTDRPNLYRRMRRLGIAIGLAIAGAAIAGAGAANADAQRPDSAAQAGKASVGAAHDTAAGRADTTNRAPATDTMASVGADTLPAATDTWWRRWLMPSHPPNYVAMSLTSSHTYNRVEGLPLYAGPTGRRVFPWGSISGDAFGIVRISDKLRWDDDHIGDAAHAELTVNAGADRSIGVGARLYDVIDPVEPWQLSNAEVGLATLFLHRDYRDYFGRHGGTLYVSFVPSSIATATLSYADERWSTRPVRDPFTLFLNTAAWRENPSLDDGVFHVLSAHVGLDTRNDQSDPWSGWYATADVEQGTGIVTSFGERSDGLPPIVPPGGSTVRYVRGFFDARRYNRLGTTEQLNLRLVLAGWLGGDELPLEQRLSVGGAGTLPGFDFRGMAGGTDVTSCSLGSGAPPGVPAQCERIALGQIEFRHDLRVGLADLVRGVPLDGAWILFADFGRGWLVGPPDGTLRYRAGTLPAFSTYRTDAGAGVALGPFGFYVAQPVVPWNNNTGPRFVIRLQQRF